MSRVAATGERVEYQNAIRCETLSKAELEPLMTDESVRTSVEQRLVRLVVGDEG